MGQQSQGQTQGSNRGAANSGSRLSHPTMAASPPNGPYGLGAAPLTTLTSSARNAPPYAYSSSPPSPSISPSMHSPCGSNLCALGGCNSSSGKPHQVLQHSSSLPHVSSKPC